MPSTFTPKLASELLDELPEALLITTLTGEIVFVNHALENLTGFGRSEIVGENVSKLMPTPERRRVQVIDWLGRWADDPDPAQLRYLNLEAVTRSGDVRLVSLRVSRHHEGDDAWFVVVMRDVTSQHEQTAALRHAQLVTNRILAIGEDAVLSIDESGAITYWNPRAEQLFGYHQDEIIGRPISLLLPPAMTARHEQLIAEFAGGDEASRLMGERGEVLGKCKDGRLIPLEVSITKTSIDGQLILSAQIRDITERKRTETALRESEAKFRAVFENAMEAMALLAVDGRVLMINTAARRMLPAFEDGQLFWTLDWWGGKDAGDARENLKANVASCAAGESIRTRTALEGPDGAVRQIDFSLIPVVPEGDDVAYILAEGRDITAVV